MILNYAVIGSGGIGGFYGSMLAKMGKEVHFLFHSDYDFVAQNGLKVDSVYGDFHLPQVNAYNSTQNMPKVDIVLVGMKTTNNHLLKDLIQPILKEDTIVVMIQNGMGVERQLAEELPGTHIAGGLAFICSEKIGPGHIHHMDLGRIIIGSYNGEDANKLEAFAKDMTEAGVPCELSENLYHTRWQKLLWNVPFNGLTVVMNSTTDQLVKSDATRQLVTDIMVEVVEAAKSCGAQLDDKLIDATLDMTLKMKPYAPSMKVDFEHKRPLEVDAIYTQPILEAKKHGYNMQKVEMLEKQLLYINEALIKE